MTEKEYFYSCLGEEGCETGQICSKINRFGLREVNKMNPRGPTNEERLIDEANDYIACLNMLVEKGYLRANWFDLEKQTKKRAKLIEWFNYSKNLGNIQ